ncbi:MAG TPA: prepilin peptidase [bacterium]|nr:prepilin peptidase [bacterium]
MSEMLNSTQFVPFTAAVVLIFGLLTGSFVNVCIYRIPQSKSIVFPPSSCTKCSHRIKWYENIPVLSWLFLRGKCSGCGEKISMIYPLVEMANGFLYLAAFIRFSVSIDMFFTFYFISAMIVIAVIDFKTQYVYSAVVLPVAVLGVLRAFFSPSISLTASFLGIIAGAGLLLTAIAVFYLVTKKIGMGLGDVYILGAIGSYTGLKMIPLVLFLASFSAILFFFVAKMVFKKKRLAENITKEDINSGNEKDLDNAIYFGPFLAGSGVLLLLIPPYLLENCLFLIN